MRFVPCQGIQRDYIERSIHQDRGKFIFSGPLFGEIHYMWSCTWDPKYRRLLDDYKAAWNALDKERFIEASEEMFREWKNRRHKAPNGWLWIIPFPRNTHHG